MVHLEAGVGDHWHRGLPHVDHSHRHLHAAQEALPPLPQQLLRGPGDHLRGRLSLIRNPRVRDLVALPALVKKRHFSSFLLFF